MNQTVTMTVIHSTLPGVKPLYVVGLLDAALYPLVSVFDYALPPGYTILPSSTGGLAIFDPDGLRCVIVHGQDGQPAIVSAGRHSGLAAVA